ncbi:MAG: Co2+/Mg2+ efflux protein ApaG [Flavobacteriales bacterium]|nr:Co2+/Mg2+ efflux protein ApaG [Flavobacteriales bacterium]
MEIALTSGIRISVQTRFEPKLSNAYADNYVFSYHITIENQNDFPIQLLRRHWFIFDSAGMQREVEGPGVVGFQPVIHPGEFYAYNSACDLVSKHGTMNGFYSMARTDDKSFIRVEIPKFKLEVPFALN